MDVDADADAADADAADADVYAVKHIFEDPSGIGGGCGSNGGTSGAEVVKGSLEGPAALW